MAQPGAGPRAAAGPGRSAAVRTGADRTVRRWVRPPQVMGHWITGLLVAFLLLVASVPIASAESSIAVLIAVSLSIGAGLSLRHPLIGAIIVGGVLTLGIGNAPTHLGSGVLASPVTIAALAAHGRILMAMTMALWHVVPPVATSVLLGSAPEFIVSQAMLWIALQVIAMLAGASGRGLVLHAAAERARRIEELAEQRRAIARELHDTGVRAMTRVVMLAEQAGGRPGIDAEDTERYGHIAQTAREGTEELRELLQSLRLAEPPAAPSAPTTDADCCSLATTLEAMRRRLSAEGFTLQISIEGECNCQISPHGVLGRCLREVEANILRHGCPLTPIAVFVEQQPQPAPGMLELAIRNGVRSKPETVPPGGLGLVSARERLDAVGGAIETTREGDLFLTHLQVPCTAEATGAHVDEVPGKGPAQGGEGR
ncbi:sensor histidine kinase [Brachybacterium sp. UMB0905]|uniref:sensor histidine kinase n=1 Tax=Brachybacterium sp. UMB0905 TaxID=2069310 RepID=UPI00130468E1|nr:histidine kinase [Brachybacterium sp. UMB0905]